MPAIHRDVMRNCLALLCGAVVISACNEGPSERLTASTDLAARPVISDAANSGRAGFFFLPPLVGQPSTSGVVDESLRPTIDICDLGAAAPDEASVCQAHTTTLTFGDGTANTIKFNASERAYHANWRTDTSNLLNGHYYRVSVAVAGTVLGFIDVTPVSGKNAVKNHESGDVVPLVDGRTLPLRFRIEKGAVFPISPAGGTLSTPDNRIQLSFPAGSIASEIGVTVDAVETTADKYQVGNATFDFGPDGSRFSEPVSVVVQYEPAALPPGRSEESLRLYARVAGGWELVAGSSVNTVTNTVAANLTHFSEYTIRSMRRLMIPTMRLYESRDLKMYIMYEDGSGLAEFPPAGSVSCGGTCVTPWPFSVATWSPSGDRVAYCDLASSALAVTRMAGGPGYYLDNGFNCYPGPGVLIEWAPDGASVLSGYGVSSTSLYVVADDVNAETKAVDPWFAPYPAALIGTATWSSDGTRIMAAFATSTWADIYSVDLEGANPVRLTFTPDRWEGLGGWSSSRQTILLYEPSGIDGRADSNFHNIYEWSPSSGNKILVAADTRTGEPGECGNFQLHSLLCEPGPVFMPGENAIMFRRAHDADGVTYNPQYVALNRDGTNLRVILDMRTLRARFPDALTIAARARWEP